MNGQEIYQEMNEKAKYIDELERIIAEIDDGLMASEGVSAGHFVSNLTASKIKIILVKRGNISMDSL